MNKKSLTFHCFRKMMLSASIDSGIGLTAGKKLVGKAISQSDDTYLTTINLRKKFIQLKNFQTITQSAKIETESLHSLEKAISNLQEDLTTQKTITNVLSKENQYLKNQVAENEQELNMVSETIMNRIIPIVDIFGNFEGLEEFLLQFKYRKTIPTFEDLEDLRKQLVDAEKKRDEQSERDYERFMRMFDEIEKESNDIDNSG